MPIEEHGILKNFEIIRSSRVELSNYLLFTAKEGEAAKQDTFIKFA